MRARFPNLVGNASYSLKNVKSQIGIEDYICKGGETLGEMPEVMEASPSWTEERIFKHHKQYHDRFITEKLANERAKKGSDSVIADNLGKIKVRQPTAIEKIAKKVISTYGEEEVANWCHNSITRTKVIRVMMEHLGEVGKGFDIIILKRLYYGVIHQILPVESTREWEDVLVTFLESGGR